ncbi:MAG: hypothetical protein ACTSSJ_06250 [Candidatus Odinarchaeia archaeon]
MKIEYVAPSKTSIFYVSVLLAIAIILNLAHLRIVSLNETITEILIIVLLIWFIVGVYLFTNWIRKTYLRYKKATV